MYIYSVRYLTEGSCVRNNEERSGDYVTQSTDKCRPPRRVKSSAAGDVVAGNQALDDVEQAGWAPRSLVDVNLRRSPSTLISDDDYDNAVDKRYMRFGRRDSDEPIKRYMRFGRAGSHFHPLMAFAKRYMRFGKR